MTAPPRSSMLSTALPASQSTAPVAEFRCLFTHDLRRKQKRWQDGFLRFHSFNSRIMVYDTSRNFLGDTYWKESAALQEGDELTLDKGVMVEVADAVGVTQTDLAPLFEKKRESPQRNLTGASQKPLVKPPIPASSALRAASQLRHKSLNTLLGTPKGHIGKAVPLRSPFEARKEKENEAVEDRPRKRQKTVQAPVHQRPSSPSFQRNATPSNAPPLRATTPDADPPRSPPRPIQRRPTTITISSETDNISSDVTLPGTSPLRIARAPPKPPPTSAAASSLDDRKQRPTYTPPKLPKGKVPVPHVKAQETPRPPPRSSSPPVSASNHLSNVDFAIQPVVSSPKRSSPSRSPPRNPKAKSLRLATGVRRGMLLCQSMPEQRDAARKEQQAVSRAKEKAQRRALPNDPIPVLSDEDCIVQPSKRAKSRGVAEVKKRQAAEPASAKDVGQTTGKERSREVSPYHCDDMDVAYGLMDQQLIAVASSSPPDGPADLRSIVLQDATPNTIRAPARKGKRAPIDSRSESTMGIAKNGSSAPEMEATETPGRKNLCTEKPQPALRVTKVEWTVEPSRDELFSPMQPPDEPTHDTSTSVPPKKIALSTGNFRKKPRSALRQPESAQPDIPVPQPATAVLPPHPLLARKNGPLMSTTELSALLQKSHQPALSSEDPIEDGSPTISPNRSFQRSRSGNDAPIPSMSDKWEKRNLPKPQESGASGVNHRPTPDTATEKPKAGGLAALVKKTDPRRKFQRTQSLNVNTDVRRVEEPEPVTPPVDDDVGPWSTEAFDLFDWRPPNREGGDKGVVLMADKL